MSQFNKARLFIAIAVGVFTVLVPGIAQADWAKPWQQSYLNTYERGHEAGFDVGRNLLDCHWKNVPCVSRERVEASEATIDGWLNPQPVSTPVAAPTSSESSEPATSSTPAPAPSGGGGGCVGMEAESGSEGYSAMSPTGYIGCYQIAPQHYNGGMCSDLGADPGGQDACAARICAEQGPGAWTNPHGQNPCGRL